MTDLQAVLTESRRLGFLGPGPIEPHIVHATAFAEAVEQDPARALDLGAGGGLPGLVLVTQHWPATRWTLLDAQAKRTRFLAEAVETLGVGDRVEIVTERAEVAGRSPSHRRGYDVVFARSFGAPAVTAECAAALLAPDGVLIVSEPPQAAPGRWPVDGLAMLGFGPPDHLRFGSAEQPVHLVRMRRSGPLDERFPRRDGVPGKRPLF